MAKRCTPENPCLSPVSMWGRSLIYPTDIDQNRTAFPLSASLLLTGLAPTVSVSVFGGVWEGINENWDSIDETWN